MNTLKVLILILSFIAIQANATTAVLCGDLTQVDENDNKASLHLIFYNPNSRSPDEVRAYSMGNGLVIQSVNEAQQKISIKLEDNKGVIQLDAQYIDPSNCENYSEDTFSMELVAETSKTIVNSCRCFQD
ncbi:MAG: hypothetical protein A2622_12605 [Bdellovibrionales bacterium RIFCSPHIGHO2_01_FULL_40_29]|nr:MAG: hypothetical protein A2622_12605 [Bdellovibrionales bacterium RIFCSPHIGHO2_01_FULL_40_29]OFZ33465.1 MAG: hypothetical protein A3D17_14280 [Bdellovibrionales bacterium RIFCSPHIGHO2_02_FULL_40_15]